VGSHARTGRGCIRSSEIQAAGVPSFPNLYAVLNKGGAGLQLPYEALRGALEDWGMSEAMLGRWPGREQQISKMISMFGEPNDHVPPLVLHGQTGTGKSTLLSDVLQDQRLRHAYIHCCECYSPRVLFESVLSELDQHQEKAAYRCNTLSEFIQHVSRICTDEATTYIVLDGVDRFRNLKLISGVNANFISALMSLQTLTAQNVCVVLTTEASNPDFLAVATSLVEVVHIHFPLYHKDQMIAILCRDCPRDEDAHIFKAFAKHVYSFLQHSCGQDLRELRHAVQTLYPKFKHPVAIGEGAACQRCCKCTMPLTIVCYACCC
jgi:origin recognition complex subunit 5